MYTPTTTCITTTRLNAAAISTEDKTTIDSNRTAVASPMVGSFYRASSPDSAPFVDIGSRCKER